MVEIKVRGPNLAKAIGRLRRQIPFTVSLAINNTAKKAQADHRRHLERAFQIRRKTFIRRATKIKPFSTKRRLWAKILIEPPGGQARADILTKFEDGGRKTPTRGSKLAVPTHATRRAGSGIISKLHRIGELNLRRRGGGGSRGDRRTYAIENVGIFQRKGRGKNSRSELIYSFKDGVPIPRSLRFESTIRRSVLRNYEREYSKAWNRALRTAA